jgi:hypothetical protein
MAKKQNIIRLTESELKDVITETVKSILTECNYSSNLIKESMTFSNDFELDSFLIKNDDLIEYLEDEGFPNICVEMIFNVEPYYPGDYYNPPYGGEVSLINYEIDTDGTFRSIFPPDLYKAFLKEVSDYIKQNKEGYESEIEINDVKDYYVQRYNDFK